MISLCIWISLFILTVLLAAWAVSVCARALGSSRGELRISLLAVVFIVAIGIGLEVVRARLPVAKAGPQLAIGLGILVVQLCATFFVFRRTFGLSVGRTFGLYGVYFVATLTPIGAAFGVIRPFVSEMFLFPTKSMTPTIEPGDRFMVNKLLRPRRWDLVAYWTVEQREGAALPVIYCKRVIALPGERLRFDHGEIFINDQAETPPPVIAGRCHASPEGAPPQIARYTDGEIIVLGDNEYFLMGDNLDHCRDSRMDGPVARSSLVGVVDLIYWPPGKARIVR